MYEKVQQYSKTSSNTRLLLYSQNYYRKHGSISGLPITMSYFHLRRVLEIQYTENAIFPYYPLRSLTI